MCEHYQVFYNFMLKYANETYLFKKSRIDI